jgi:hypothetical protein
MTGFADTGFIISLYLEESTSKAADKALTGWSEPLPLTPLITLEFRNALNLAIPRGRISEAERDEIWRRFQGHIAAGTFVEMAIPSAELHAAARRLSDRHTPMLATRSLDLLHVAAAVSLGATVFYSFDERQRKAAAGEGLEVRP